MPLGNGRLGAMVSDRQPRAHPAHEKSLWMGRRATRDSPEALTTLPEVRRLLFADLGRGDLLAEKKLMGRPSRLHLSDARRLRLAFDHEGAVSDYRRERTSTARSPV